MLLRILRSLAFYAAFYGGSAIYVLMAVIAVYVAPGIVAPISDHWPRFHRACLRWLAGIRVEVTGDIPPGPALYAYKHESFFEAIDLAAALNRPVGFAKQELFKIPGWGRVAAHYGMIPVARSDGAKALRNMLVAARRVTQSGRPLVIFPEGTRVPHGQKVRLKSGFAALYKALNIPVVPVAVDSGKTYAPLWKKPGVIHMHFGEPVEPGLSREELEARVLPAINLLNS